jgi:tetratricopeptide (TPR) repeat protein
LAQQIAGQIPARGNDFLHRAQALAQVAGRLAASGGKAEVVDVLFEDALASAIEVSGLDDRAKSLAGIARHLAAAGRTQRAKGTFEEALDSVRAMTVDLDPAMREEVSASTMVSQTAPESAAIMNGIPFDTAGAKARALADVAAEMDRAGQSQLAEAVFDEAEGLLHQMPAIMEIHELFSSHTSEYIAAKRHPEPEEPQPEPAVAAVEASLETAEGWPPDLQGFYGLTLQALARALLAGGRTDQARHVLERAEAVAQEAQGGYRAKLLADAAALWQEAGDSEKAAALTGKARTTAGKDADLLAGYRALLARVGRQWAASLREVAMSRAIISKQRYYSDKAVSQMAQSLAADDPEEALVLAHTIQDGSQRACALASVAGHLAVTDADAAGGWIRKIIDIASGLAEDSIDYVLASSAEILAPLYPPGAEQISEAIADLSFKTATLVDAAAGRAEQGMDSAAAWDRVWSTAQSTSEGGATLAMAVARIGQHWAEAGDARAADAFALAQEAVQVEPSPVERIDAMIQIAMRLGPSRPDEACALLEEARTQAGAMRGARARGQALSRIAGAYMDLDPERAWRLLAELRGLGRDSFLDGVARIVPGAARLGGTELVSQVFAALEDGRSFFKE